MINKSSSTTPSFFFGLRAIKCEGYEYYELAGEELTKGCVIEPHLKFSPVSSIIYLTFALPSIYVTLINSILFILNSIILS